MSTQHRQTSVSAPSVVVGVVAMGLSVDDELVVRVRRTGDGLSGEGWELPVGSVSVADRGGPTRLDRLAEQVLGASAGAEPSSAAYLRQFRTYLVAGHGEKPAILTVAYLAVAREGDVRAGGGWVPVDELLTHRERIAAGQDVILGEAVEQVRELLETTALGLAFCDEQFTIPRLRRVYEVVWGLRRDYLDAGTFHKRVTNAPNLLVRLPAGESRGAGGGQGRPPQFYKAGPLAWAGGTPMRLDRPIDQPGRSWALQGGALPAVDAERDAAAEAEPPSSAVDPVALAKARRLLWECGARGEFITYGDLAAKIDANLRSPGFFELLDTLCRQEHAAGGPMVTALVVNKRTEMPGQRFFVLADELGREFHSLSEFVDGERIWAFEWIQAHPERADLSVPDVVPAPTRRDSADDALDAARRIIWERGAAGEVIPYGELAEQIDMKVFSAAFFKLLDDICIEEDAAGGPMVTSLIVNKATGVAGRRFFTLAASLGRTFEDEGRFLDSERARAVEWIREHPERAHSSGTGAEAGSEK